MMDRLTDMYHKDKSRLSLNEIRIVEQQLLFKKKYSEDKISESPPHGTSYNHSIEGKSKGSFRNPSPSPDKYMPHKKLNDINEEFTSTREDPSLKEFSVNQLLPQNKRTAFKENISANEIAELDGDMLTKIRDQLLLQKMYEDDLGKFKKFKTKQKVKKRKGKSRQSATIGTYHQGRLLYLNI